MNRRGGWHRTLKWLAASFVALMAIAWFASVGRSMGYMASNWGACLSCGTIGFGHTAYVGPDHMRRQVTLQVSENSGWLFVSHPDLAGVRQACGCVLPTWSREAQDLSASVGIRVVNAGLRVPIWLLLALILIPAIWLWRPRRGMPARGCGRCGYDLTGNVSGTCPECGCATESLGKEDGGVGPQA